MTGNMETGMSASHNQQLDSLLNICIALTSRPSTSSVLRELMTSVKSVTNADGGSLYLLNNDGSKLRAVMVRNDTLKIESDQDAPEVIKSLQIPLVSEQGSNVRNLVAHAVNHKKLINIADRHKASGFDFSGANSFDQRFGYASKSFLILPLINSDGRCLGAIQLINARSEGNEVCAFDEPSAQFAQGIASLAATALTNRSTMQDLEQLFEYFAELLALMNDHLAIGNSPDVSRALLLTLSLAKAMHHAQEAPFTQFKINDTVLREIKIAGWLRSWALQHRNVSRTKHSGATDLRTLIEERLEIVRRDLKLKYYEALQQSSSPESASSTYHQSLRQLESHWRQIIDNLNSNQPASEPLVTLGASHQWQKNGRTLDLISLDESKQLIQEALAKRGSQVEQPDTTRAIIEMLSTLRLPSYLGQALSLANLNSLLDSKEESEPLIFDPNGKLIYQALRISEQLSRLLGDVQPGNDTHIQQALKLLRNNTSLSRPLVELLIKQGVYEAFV